MFDLTVIIPTQASERRKPYLEACVRTLSHFNPNLEIIIVTNGEGCQELNLKGINCYLYHNTKQGQCSAVNFALKYVQTKYVMVTNDDMLYGAGWERAIERNIEKYRIVVPNLLEPNGGAIPFMSMPNLGDTLNTFNEKLWFNFISQFHNLFPPDVIEDGFNLPFITETEILKSIGGYDEAYDPFGANSDSDLEYSFMLAGLHPTRIKSSLVFHFSLQSSDATKGEPERRGWFINKEYFINKWGFERQMEDPIWYAGGTNGIRIPTKDKPYIFEHAAGHGIHPGQDYLEFHPEWEGKYGETFYGNGKYYSQ